MSHRSSKQFYSFSCHLQQWVAWDALSMKNSSANKRVTPFQPKSTVANRASGNWQIWTIGQCSQFLALHALQEFRILALDRGQEVFLHESRYRSLGTSTTASGNAKRSLQIQKTVEESPSFGYQLRGPTVGLDFQPRNPFGQLSHLEFLLNVKWFGGGLWKEAFGSTVVPHIDSANVAFDCKVGPGRLGKTMCGRRCAPLH